MYGRRIVGGKISILKPQLQVNPLNENVVNKKVEEVVSQQHLGNNGKEIINNSLETKKTEPLKKTRNEKILKFINFQI
jgi:hypothetical protein